MIYLDTCYILKCYLTETGSLEVRRLTQSASGLASCILARAEFFGVVHRHFREGKLSVGDVRRVLRDFRLDIGHGLWKWFPMSDSLIDDVAIVFESLPASVFLRAADAIHLACARAQGFREIYSNDRRLLATAGVFSLRGVNVIS